MSAGFILNQKQADWLQSQYKKRTGTDNQGGPIQFREETPETIVFKNNSAETVPAYGLIHITGYVEANDRDILTCNKPATTIGWYMANGPREVEAGKYGVAQYGPLVKVVYDSADNPAAGNVYGVDGFKARSYPDGEPLLQVIIHGVIDSNDKIAYARLEPFTSLMIEAPSNGIPGRVGKLLGGVNCTVLCFKSGSDEITQSGVSVNVLNWSTSSACAKGDRYGIASFIDGKWFIVAEDCNDEGSTVQGASSSGTVTTPTDPLQLGSSLIVGTGGAFQPVTWYGAGVGSGFG